MGVFDYVVFRCPSCSETLEDQSKAGSPSFSRYKLEDAPPEVIRDVSNCTRHCPHCGNSFHIKSKITVEVKVLPGHIED